MDDTDDPDADDAKTANTTFACPYCARTFAGRDLRALHLGWEHSEELDATERVAFEDAFEAETQELRVFRLKLVFALVVLYFVVLFLFALVT